jgi:hypothetical protein
VKIIKRRAAGGKRLHFLEGRTGKHEHTALCGHTPADSPGSRFERRAAWRLPEASQDNMAPNGMDCPRCVDQFIRRGGQFG